MAEAKRSPWRVAPQLMDGRTHKREGPARRQRPSSLGPSAWDGGLVARHSASGDRLFPAFRGGSWTYSMAHDLMRPTHASCNHVIHPSVDRNAIRFGKYPTESVTQGQFNVLPRTMQAKEAVRNVLIILFQCASSRSSNTLIQTVHRICTRMIRDCVHVVIQYDARYRSAALSRLECKSQEC